VTPAKSGISFQFRAGGLVTVMASPSQDGGDRETTQVRPSRANSARNVQHCPRSHTGRSGSRPYTNCNRAGGHSWRVIAHPHQVPLVRITQSSASNSSSRSPSMKWRTHRSTFSRHRRAQRSASREVIAV